MENVGSLVLSIGLCFLLKSVECSGDPIINHTILKSTGQTLNFECNGLYLLHVGSVKMIQDTKTEICIAGTMLVRNYFEGRGHTDFDGSDYIVKLMEEVTYELERVCYYQGDFNITYQCLQMHTTPASVINPTQQFETPARSNKNFSIYLHNEQSARSYPSFGFQCKLTIDSTHRNHRNKRENIAIVTVWDAHTSNPEYPYPVFCIKNGRVECHTGQLDMSRYNLKVEELFHLSSLEDRFENTYFIEITAFRGAILKCVPSMEILTEENIENKSFIVNPSTQTLKPSTVTDKVNTEHSHHMETHHDRELTHHDRDSTHHDRDSTYHDRDSTHHDTDSAHHDRDSPWMIAFIVLCIFLLFVVPVAGICFCMANGNYKVPFGGPREYYRVTV